MPAPGGDAPADIAFDVASARLSKRSLRVAGHATSVSLESAFWTALGVIARRRGVSVDALVTAVDSRREGNLSSALRVFVLAEISFPGSTRDDGNEKGEAFAPPSR